jgi:hypothetical protein
VSQRATIEIAVTSWAPVTFSEIEHGPALVRIAVEETFSGDVVGEGAAEMLQVLQADGSASFVAVERITGTIGGRTGSFVLQDRGTLDAEGNVEGEWFVVPGSGSGELAGLQGAGAFRARLGEHAVAHIDYTFAA